MFDSSPWLKTKGLSLTSNCKTWRLDEIEFLKKNYTIKGALWCSEHFPERTIEGIRIKASRLNLKRDKEERYGIVDTPNGYYFCGCCEQTLPNSNFYDKKKTNKYGYKPHQICRSCSREKARRSMRKNSSSSRENYHKNPHKKIFMNLKSRATAKNIPFNLDISDIVIPVICPVLNIPIIPFSKSDNSPSVDRLIPALGYVKGNINIISNRANRIKSDATLEEIEAIVNWLKSL